MFRGNNLTEQSKKSYQLKCRSALTSLIFALIVLTLSHLANAQERTSSGKTPQTAPAPASFDLYANLDARLGEKLQDNEAEITRKIAETLKGLLFTVQKALPLMPDGASIILNASIVASKGLPANSVYSATKAAVRSFARTFAAEHRPDGVPTHLGTV